MKEPFKFSGNEVAKIDNITQGRHRSIYSVIDTIEQIISSREDVEGGEAKKERKFPDLIALEKEIDEWLEAAEPGELSAWLANHRGEQIEYMKDERVEYDEIITSLRAALSEKDARVNELEKQIELPNGYKKYQCTDCKNIDVLKNNGEITVGFCTNCGHPLWND